MNQSSKKSYKTTANIKEQNRLEKQKTPIKK